MTTLNQLLGQLQVVRPVEASRAVIVEALRLCEEKDGAKATLVRLPPGLAHRLLEGQYPGEAWPRSFCGVPLEVCDLPAFVFAEIVSARGYQVVVEC